MKDQLPKHDHRVKSILLGSEQISERVEELAAEIAADYRGKGELTLVSIIKGAVVFTADLARALSRQGMEGIRLAFIRASTYGNGMKGEGEASRQVQIDTIGAQLVTPNLLLIDDVLDQGFTLSAVKRFLKENQPNVSVKTAVFLRKKLAHPSPEVLELRQHFQPDYVGFDIDDRWIVGYGLDVDELYRELPYVALVDENAFK
ncbi:MAG: hypothetical protein IJJ33_05640 [Victivallales bacterium]|nr:hypothetical protein [Victivallales bacterium]